VSHGVGAYQCHCPAGYSGTDCEVEAMLGENWTLCICLQVPYNTGWFTEITIDKKRIYCFQ